MSKHTPRPWRVDQHTVWAPTEDNRNNRFFATVQSSRSAGTADTAELTATARLIAAAPELLEALRDVLVYADTAAAQMELRASRNPGEGTLGAAKVARRILDTARAAIAKAEGK